jgi:small subunit ribosomal protein S21
MKVTIRDGQSFESGLRKFKNKVADSNLLQEVRERQTYEKPTTTRKIAKARARSRWKKHLASQELPKKLY